MTDVASRPSGSREYPASLEAFNHQQYRWFWIASAVSNSGTLMNLAAMGWVVEVETDSAFKVTIIAVFGMLPMLVMSPVGGALADRFPRRNVLAGCIIAQALVSLGLAIAYSAGQGRYGVLLAFSALGGFASSPGAPVQQAIVPELVPVSSLRNAVTLNSAQWNLARAVGPVLGGVLIKLVGPGAAFWFNAISFGVLLFALRYIIAKPAPAPSGASFWQDFRAGLRYVRAEPGLMMCLTTGVFISVVLGPIQWLVPVIARDAFGVGAAAFGILAGAFGTGSVVGAIMLLRVEQRFLISNMMRAGTGGLAISGVALGLAPIYALGLVAMFFAGLSFMTAISNLLNAIHAIAADAYRGRVMSIWMMMFGLVSPLVVLVQGGLAEVTNIRVVLVGSGAICGAFVLLAGGRFSLTEPDPSRMADESP